MPKSIWEVYVDYLIQDAVSKCIHCIQLLGLKAKDYGNGYKGMEYLNGQGCGIGFGLGCWLQVTSHTEIGLVFDEISSCVEFVGENL